MKISLFFAAALAFAQTLVAAEAGSVATSAGANRDETPAQRGYRLLTTRAYLAADFDQQIFDELWKTWDEPLRSLAEQATPERRREMAFHRYGLTSLPGDASGKPQQYVVDDQGNWTMNCLACHQGKVAGKVIPGAPNSLFALETLTEEVRQTKLRLGKPLTRLDIGLWAIPLGTTQGTTNSVVFGIGLMARRDADLNIVPLKSIPRFSHHDLDAPAWWLFKKKERLYADGFAPKGHRALMQFMMTKENGPEKFRAWEADYRDVYAWMESLEPPAYPFAVNRKLAAGGEAIFNDHCAECHGTYGTQGTYPNKIVPIEEVGTDRARLDALTSENRAGYEASWFAHYGQEKVIADPGGYVAPPLDGIWASAPYLHNGSVPTLWHVLHPDQRPVVWRRTEDGYDQKRVGLEVATFDSMPEKIPTSRERRQFFNTRLFGKSAAGHEFPDELDEGQKNAVLEYLKTL